ncbi:MAG TPA: response regulator, partial [Candidatus Dormibacteraeota bacterium]|nr:response regulator [Candidatus Dormibacteraeota bacterium]
NGLKGVVATRGEDALPLARAYRPAAVTLELQDTDGWEVLEALGSDPLLRQVPVAVVTAVEGARERLGDREGVRLLTRAEAREGLRRLFAEVRSGEVAPRPDAPAPSGLEGEVAWTEVQSHPDPVLFGRTVLVVDDDVRNVFALTAMLERHGLRVIPAEGGQQAVAALERSERIDLVLLDVMMPDVDGYETIRRIRGHPRFADLPIVALTAKAMKGDRERCLEAGASDYVAKPVEPTQLLSVLRSRLRSTS